VPFKSVITAPWSPIVTPTHFPSMHQQAVAKTCWKLPRGSHRHPSTQTYATVYGDFTTAKTGHHENAPHTVHTQQATLPQTRQMVYQRKKIASITLKSNSTMGFTTTTDQKHECQQCRDAHYDCHPELSKPLPQKTQTKTNLSCPSLRTSISTLSTMLSDINDKALVIIDQMHTLELLVRKVQQSCNMAISPTPTNAKSSHQDLTLPTTHTATPASNQHNAYNSIAGNNLNHSNPTIDPTAPHNRSS